MSDELISVSEIAKIHARHRSVIHKIIGRLGIETHSIKSEEVRGQKSVYIAQRDYELLKGALNNPPSSKASEDINESSGYFYIIQLEPTFDAGRFKLGFTMSVDDRLRSHRTSAPFAAVVQYWPCKLGSVRRVQQNQVWRPWFAGDDRSHQPFGEGADHDQGSG